MSKLTPGHMYIAPWKPEHIVLPPSEAMAEAVVKFVSDPIGNVREFDQECDKAARRAVQSAMVANNAIERMMGD